MAHDIDGVVHPPSVATFNAVICMRAYKMPIN